MLEDLPRILRARFRRIITGAIAAGASAILIEEALRSIWTGIGDSDLTPEQIDDAERRFREAVESLQRIDVTAQPIEPQGLGGDIVVNRSRRSGGMPPPGWEQLPAPGAPPSGASSTTTGTGEGLRVRVRRALGSNWLPLTLGALGLLSSRRGSRSNQIVNVAPASAVPVPVPDALPTGLTQVQPAVLTYPFSGLSSPTAQRTCECKATKKRKRRKCLERAQIEWRSGRYKGKLAGTKCVRWSDL